MATRLLQEKNITLVNNADIHDAEIVDQRVFFVAKDGRKFEFDEAIWCVEVCSLIHMDS